MNIRNASLGAFSALVLLAIAACTGTSSGPGGQIPPALGVGSTSISSGLSINLAATTGLAQGAAVVSGTGTVKASQSLSAPTGTTVLAAKKRMTGSSPAGQTPIAYITITAASAVTMQSVQVQVAPTPAPAATKYSLAYWNGTQWVSFLSGTGAVITATPAPTGVITLGPITLTPPVTLASGASYYLAVYSGGDSFTTPTPGPAAPQVSPGSITLTEGQQGTLTVTSGGNIAITATSGNTAIATVTATATTGPGVTSTAAFTVSAQTGAPSIGSTTITFKDPLGQTTTATVNVNDNAPTPSPDPGAPTIGLGSVAAIGISAKPSTQVTITSVSPSIATVNGTNSVSGASSSTTITTDSHGGGTFYVVGVAGGTSMITLADTYGNVGSMVANVSAITNGSFTNGTTGWTPCTYQHADAAAGINATQYLNSSSVASYATVQATQGTGSSVPAPTSTPLSNFVTVVSPPPNDNPGYPSAGTVSIITYPSPSPGASYTITTPATAPTSLLGNDVMLLGSLNASTNPYPAGSFGMCQTFTVPTAEPYLSFYVWEGGEYYKANDDDQEAAIFSPSFTGYQTTSAPSEYLFLEWNCYLDPAGGWGTGESASNSCLNTDTVATANWFLGGFWSPRGPYNLSAYAGQSVTLFMGVWSYFADSGSTSAKYNIFMYVGNVQTAPTGVLPTSAPLIKGRLLQTVTLRPRASVQTAPIRH